MKKIGLVLLLALALMVATASAPNGWRWDKGAARADDGTTGWSWNEMPEGWSWNQAEIVSTGGAVTVADGSDAATVAAPAGVDPAVGDTVAIVDTGTDTFVGFEKEEGGMGWTELGWSWNG
jgi:hypothetical protein